LCPPFGANRKEKQWHYLKHRADYRPPFQAAFDFGLTDEVVWEVVLEVTKRFPDQAPINESLDAMAEALAEKIEEKREEQMSIEKISRENGTVWRVRWREGGRNRSKVIGRKRDAEMFDAELRRQRRLGTIGLVDGGDETLSAFAEEWWRLYVLPNLEPSTQDFYKWMRDTHVLPHLGGHRLRELTPEQLEHWKAAMVKRGVGTAIQAKAITLLQGILQRAFEWGRIPSNPARVVRRPRQLEHAAIEPLGPKAIEGMRLWFLDQRRLEDAALVSVLAYAGLRPGEALGLTWGRMRERTLLVEQTASMGALKPYSSAIWRSTACSEAVPRIRNCSSQSKLEGRGPKTTSTTGGGDGSMMPLKQSVSIALPTPCAIASPRCLSGKAIQ
jgi:hypothetical protein